MNRLAFFSKCCAVNRRNVYRRWICLKQRPKKDLTSSRGPGFFIDPADINKNIYIINSINLSTPLIMTILVTPS